MDTHDPRVIVALDFDAPARALALVDRLDARACHLKVGSELFVTAGPALVRELVARGFKVFLDLKFHDIPNTVAQACAAATRLGVWMMNVHASGGRAMLEAARDAVRDAARDCAIAKPLLIAVTVLTSLRDADVRALGVDASAAEHALALARGAAACGLDGAVCSAMEARALRDALGSAFTLVTPGIRPPSAAAGDQARIVTPEAAVAAGADYLVVGRPITQAEDPVAALADINRSLEALA